MNNAFYLKALDKIKEKKLAEAILFLDKAIEEEPTNPVYVSERGVCYLNLNQFGRALQDMDESVRLEPNYSYRYASRGYVKDRMGDTEGGIEDYRIAVKLDPEDAIAMNNLGLLQEKLGYKKSSERSFKRADKLAEENPNSLPDMSEVQEKAPETVKVKDSTLPSVGSVKTSNEEGVSGVFSKIFTDKKTRQEFIQFIKNGFKIKQD